MNIKIVPYNLKWPQIYQEEAKLIKKALEESYIEIHHIGSTSVPNLDAKPKIDILVVVNDFPSVDVNALENIGFENRGEIIQSGRFFAKRSSQNKQFNLHLFEKDNPLIERNLLFRNWLRIHEDDRISYASFKNELAKRHTDGMEYCREKTEFINGIIEKARCKKR